MLTIFAACLLFASLVVGEDESCACGHMPSQVSRIIGGMEAQGYPWIVGFIGRPGVEGAFCGGALINKRYVLTASHCVKQTPDWSIISAVIGNNNLSSIREQFKIEDAIAHENYSTNDGYGYDNDIALIKLSRDSTATPLCLPDIESADNPLTILTVAGWGATYENKTNFVRILQEVNVNTTKKLYQKCQTAYGSKFITEKHICAIDKGRDACNGDSGGPLMSQNQGYFTAAGIVSYGSKKKCADTRNPGVYAKVSWYLDWIKKMTQDTEYCVKPSGFKST